MTKKTKIFMSIVIITLSVALFIGYSSFSSSNYLEKEHSVQKSIINTFDINTNDYKLFVMTDIGTAIESSEIRGKITSAYLILIKSNDIKVGDFKPMIFLKGNKVLIGIKHSDETITLSEFDISKEEAVKVDEQVKAVIK